MKFDEASKYEMLVARLNYLSSGRPDVQHAVKEASKHMARPQLHHWSLLKRLGKYMIDAPRVVQTFKWQRIMSIVPGYSDSDWVGDQKTRKSTSGGVCKVEPHTFKTWSSTQQMIALSSAEAEFYALLKCACQTLGVINLAHDFGINLEGTVHIDASAALAITQRQGLGKLRHINVQWLWTQERIKKGDLSAHKVHGKDNPADLMTQHLSGDEIVKHLSAMDFEVAIGKADKSLTLNQVAHTTVDKEGIGETRAQFLIRKWREIFKQYPPRPDDSLKALAELQRTQCCSESKAHESSTPRCLVPSGVDRQAVQDCDHWPHDEQCVIRRHTKPRRTFYDPFQCMGSSRTWLAHIHSDDSW